MITNKEWIHEHQVSEPFVVSVDHTRSIRTLYKNARIPRTALNVREDYRTLCRQFTGGRRIRQKGIVRTELVLIRLKDEFFGRDESHHKAEIVAMGYRPATVYELLAFAKRLPKIAKTRPVVALGTMRKVKFMFTDGTRLGFAVLGGARRGFRYLIINKGLGVRVFHLAVPVKPKHKL